MGKVATNCRVIWVLSVFIMHLDAMLLDAYACPLNDQEIENSGYFYLKL
jgi:hypothetical protein